MDTTVPQQLIAGDTWQWSYSLPDYPSASWALTFTFKNELGQAVEPVTAVASGTDYSITVPATSTAGAVPGRYRWYATVVSAGVRHTVGQGWVEISADPAVGAALDARSMSKRTLDALECMLLGRASRDQQAMSVNGRSISRLTIPELEQWRDTLKREVAAEEAAASSGAGRNIKVRFSRG